MVATAPSDCRVEGLAAASEEASREPASAHSVPMCNIALLTGGIDRPYATGLATALAACGVQVDILGSKEIDSPEIHATANLRFINVWPRRTPNPNAIAKLRRTVGHYASMMRYAARTEARLFHILWNSKVQWFDRTLLMLYYKILGKKVALTAHNVNQAKRDGNDSVWNRLTLRMQYHLCAQIFVHTEKMKRELIDGFGVMADAVTVIRHPVNYAFPDTDLTPLQARNRLNLERNQKVILCLGRIKSYKGVEHLLIAFRGLAQTDNSFRLLVAGEVQTGHGGYVAELEQIVSREIKERKAIFTKRFIPDAEMEVYLKAADVLVLPYNDIFQSGVLFLGYSFGLPVITTDVGSFREEIVEGQTGYICRPGDPEDLANTIRKYFASDMYRSLGTHRQAIKDYADTHHSWSAVAALTRTVYASLLRTQPL